MSTDFSFYTKITLQQVREETNIKVIEYNGNTFLEDSKGNKLVVNQGVFTKEDSDEIDEDSFELTRYGDNNPKEIIDELVNKFGLKFLIDDDEDELIFKGEEDFDFDSYLNDCMKKYGY